MRWLLWAAGLVILAVICLAAYRAFSSPAFYMTLVASIVAAVLPAILKRKPLTGLVSEKTDHHDVAEGKTPKLHMPGPKPNRDRKPVVKVNK